MTTVEELSRAIVAQVEAWVKSELQSAAAEPELTLEAAVQRVQEGLRSVGRELVAAVVRVADSAGGAPTCGCGQVMWSKGPQTRFVDSSLGDLRVPVRRWRCPACGAERQPLVERSELHGSCTGEWWPVVEALVAWLPYRGVEAVLGRLGCPMSDNKLQRLAKREGGQQAAARTAAALALAAGRAVAARWQPERLYQEVDGCFVHGQARGQYHEVRVGVHFETPAGGPDGLGRPPQARRLAALASVTQEPEDGVAADSFMRLVYAQGEACGALEAGEMVLLSDGAEWIWNRAGEAVPYGTRKVEILDYFHAAERLSAVAAALHGAGTERAERVAKGWRSQLKARGGKPVLARLAKLQPTSAEGREALRTALGYFGKHRERMAYPRLRRAGYHIGSGTVESWCKQVLHRVDGAGMRWSKPGLEAILCLRCKTLTEWWQPSPRKKAA